MNIPFDSGEEYIEQQFSGLSILQEAVTAVTFEECTFTDCNFSETQFKRCTFRDCRFHNCDLTLLDVDYGRFQRCKFTECKLIGINWAKAGQVQWIEFHDCNLSYCTFMELDLSKAVLSHCLAKEATFAETNLTDANCTFTDFEDGRFIHTNLTRADFRGAKNYAIAATENTLKQTKFSLPEAIALLDGLDIILENPAS
ncbi:MAG: pentapeptide repeat-containing protein [Chloroflexota bacterium]